MSGLSSDDIDRMAREVGFSEYHLRVLDQGIYRLADLVAAAEREACAKVCDEKAAAEYATGKVDHNEMGWTQSCAIAIRARGLAQLNASAEANGEEL